jgi:glucokinase
VSTHPGQSILVYDVGGSHVSAAVCSNGVYRLGRVVRAPHAPGESSREFIDRLYALGAQASEGAGALSGAGLAMPGPFDFEAGMSLMRHKLPYLYGVDLRQPLSERFGWRPGQVRFLSDAAAFLLGEMGAGAARGARRAAGFTLGTGIGSAFAVNGHIARDGFGVPPGGEIWNLAYATGTVEDFASTRAIQGFYHRRTQRHRDVAEIARAAANEEAACDAFAEFGFHLGRALHGIVSDFSPDLVVLGGGISRAAHLFLPAAGRELEDLRLDLRVCALQDRAPLVGAAVAWFNGSAPAEAEATMGTEAQLGNQ